MVLLEVRDLVGDGCDSGGLGLGLAEAKLGADGVEVRLGQVVELLDLDGDHRISHVVADRTFVEASQVARRLLDGQAGGLRGAGLRRGLDDDRHDPGAVIFLGATEEVGESLDGEVFADFDPRRYPFEALDNLGLSSGRLERQDK